MYARTGAANPLDGEGRWIVYPQKRALVARALAQEPSVMLLDEPVASLDLGHQIAVCDLVAERATSGGVAVVMVLHDLNLAARYCERLLVMRRGEAPLVATSNEVITRERLREVFHVDAFVGACPADERPFYVPLRGPRKISAFQRTTESPRSAL